MLVEHWNVGRHSWINYIESTIYWWSVFLFRQQSDNSAFTSTRGKYQGESLVWWQINTICEIEFWFIVPLATVDTKNINSAFIHIVFVSVQHLILSSRLILLNIKTMHALLALFVIWKPMIQCFCVYFSFPFCYLFSYETCIFSTKIHIYFSSKRHRHTLHAGAFVWRCLSHVICSSGST